MKIKPVLEWLVGRDNLVNEIKRCYSRIDFGDYYEPFFGAGAVFVDVKRITYDAYRHFYLGDSNEGMIIFYYWLRKDPYLLFKELGRSNSFINESVYLNIRQEYNKLKKTSLLKWDLNSPVSLRLAVLFGLLNKTCVNGVCRTDKRNVFNAPYSNKKYNGFCTENAFLYSRLLNTNCTLRYSDFECLGVPKKNDLVYLDPPFYMSDNVDWRYGTYFLESDHIRLCNYFKKLDTEGVYVILTTNSSDFVMDLYNNFKHKIIITYRFVTPEGVGILPVREMLVIGNTLACASSVGIDSFI